MADSELLIIGAYKSSRNKDEYLLNELCNAMSFSSTIYDKVRLGYFNIELYDDPEADSEILKRGGPPCRPPWSANEETFRLQMVLKG